LLDHLDSCDRLIVVVATVGGRGPGTGRRLSWADLSPGSAPGRSSHGVGAGTVLALAEALGRLPPRVVVFGIEAEAWGPAGGVSPAVARALPGLAARVLAEVAQGRTT
jgi:hydrogenase maturation protease